MRFRRNTPPAAAFTTVEREVLALLVRGVAATEVAERVAISVADVERHRAELIGKLEAMAAADLAAGVPARRFRHVERDAARSAPS